MIFQSESGCASDISATINLTGVSAWVLRVVQGRDGSDTVDMRYKIETDAGETAGCT